MHLYLEASACVLTGICDKKVPVRIIKFTLYKNDCNIFLFLVRMDHVTQCATRHVSMATVWNPISASVLSVILAQTAVWNVTVMAIVIVRGQVQMRGRVVYSVITIPG